MTTKITTNKNLQERLVSWVALIEKSVLLPSPSKERNEAIYEFVTEFVPKDVEQEDINYFANNLTTDEEFYLSLLRELKQCISGEAVENIEGNQRNKAKYTLLPPAGTVSEGKTLDIVREVAFISKDGIVWTAEVKECIIS